MKLNPGDPDYDPTANMVTTPDALAQLAAPRNAIVAGPPGAYVPPQPAPHSQPDWTLPGQLVAGFDPAAPPDTQPSWLLAGQLPNYQRVEFVDPNAPATPMGAPPPDTEAPSTTVTYAGVSMTYAEAMTLMNMPLLTQTAASISPASSASPTPTPLPSTGLLTPPSPQLVAPH